MSSISFFTPEDDGYVDELILVNLVCVVKVTHSLTKWLFATTTLLGDLVFRTIFRAESRWRP